MYGHRSRRMKTDRRDVAALADACRHGNYRPAHRRSARQRDGADRCSMSAVSSWQLAPVRFRSCARSPAGLASDRSGAHRNVSRRGWRRSSSRHPSMRRSRRCEASSRSSMRSSRRRTSVCGHGRRRRPGRPTADHVAGHRARSPRPRSWPRWMTCARFRTGAPRKSPVTWVSARAIQLRRATAPRSGDAQCPSVCAIVAGPGRLAHVSIVGSPDGRIRALGAAIARRRGKKVAMVAWRVASPAFSLGCGGTACRLSADATQRTTKPALAHDGDRRQRV